MHCARSIVVLTRCRIYGVDITVYGHRKLYRQHPKEVGVERSLVTVETHKLNIVCKLSKGALTLYIAVEER